MRFSLFFRSALVLIAALSLTVGCSSDDATVVETPPTTSDVVITAGQNGVQANGDIAAENTTGTTTVNWVRTNKYVIRGNVFVPRGVVLNIESGTIIKGDFGTNRGTLIVLAGGRINSNGTSTQPVVFTSNRPAGSRNYGDWGGILIVGRATSNLAAAANIEGGIQRGGVAVQWGGPTPGGLAIDDNDNSGIIRYTRIEFGGVPVAPNNETNGLTMYGVGRATTVEYVQVSFIGDDGFEWFGGNVNAKYLVSYRSLDDDFDTDNGWSGKVQYGLAIRDNNFADVSGSNAFESDNNSGGTAVTPFTTGTFSNITVIGPGDPSGTNISGDYNAAIHIRRGSRLNIHNSVFAGFRTQVIIEGPGSYLATPGAMEPTATGSSSQVDFAAGTLLLRSNLYVNPLVASNTVGNITGWSVAMARVAPYPQTANSNTTLVPYQTNATLRTDLLSMANGSTEITAAVAGTTPNNNIATAMGLNANVWTLGVTPTLLPIAGSPLLSGASFTGLTTTGSTDPNGNFVTTTFRGAFGTTDWTTGWTNWNPQTTAY
jgi:hypothetical protein